MEDGLLQIVSSLIQWIAEETVGKKMLYEHQRLTAPVDLVVEVQIVDRGVSALLVLVWS